MLSKGSGTSLFHAETTAQQQLAQLIFKQIKSNDRAWAAFRRQKIAIEKNGAFLENEWVPTDSLPTKMEQIDQWYRTYLSLCARQESLFYGCKKQGALSDAAIAKKTVEFHDLNETINQLLFQTKQALLDMKTVLAKQQRERMLAKTFASPSLEHVPEKSSGSLHKRCKTSY